MHWNIEARRGLSLRARLRRGAVDNALRLSWLIFLLLGCRIEAAPSILWAQPAVGTTVSRLDQITVEFSEPVGGVQAGSLRIDGIAATNVLILSSWQYSFRFPAAAAGIHQIAWSPDLPVRPLQGTPIPTVPGSWTLRVVPRSGGVALRITKFMADNQSTLKDQDGAFSDWIEIWNPSDAPVTLTGWGLTTNLTGVGAWKFPNYALDSGERLIVFASGKKRAAVTNEFHTDFKLKKSGGYLALIDPTGTPVSEFGPGYPSQTPDTAFGRDPIAPDLTGFFANSSPGKVNSSVGIGFAGDVLFSVGARSFVTPVPLELSCPTPGAAIFYTLDGTLPTEFSTAYGGPITLANSVQMRARAFAPGALPGPVHTETYTRIQTSLASISATLPTIVLYNFGAGIPSTDPNAAPQPLNFALLQPTDGRIVLTNEPILSARAEISVRGSSTRYLPKQSWALKFRDEFDGDQSVPLLGMPSNSHWVLYAPNNFEPVLMHNPLAYRLSNDSGRYAPRTRFVVVYIATGTGPITTAAYNGIYVLEEEIRHGKGRVDVPGLQPDDNGLPAVTGGYLLKVDRLGPGESGLSAANQSMAFVDPSESTLTTPQRAPQYQYINQYMRNFGTALYGSRSRDPVVGYAAYIDPPAWIDHSILNVVTFNVDALRLSAYFNKPRQGKLFFGPVWDFDRTQGSTDGRDFNPRLWRSSGGDLGTDFFNYTWWDRLFRDIDFWQRWIDRYQNLRQGALSTDHVNSVIDEFAAQLRTEQPREAARWAGTTTPRSGTQSIAGYSYNFPGTYQGEVNFLKKWYADRFAFIDTNFLARPAAQVTGDPAGVGLQMVFQSPVGSSVYFTTNGVDPRAVGGGIADAAQLYAGPVSVDRNVRIRARSYDPNHRNLTGANKPPLSSPWSGELSLTLGAVNEADHVAYTIPGVVYSQAFDALPPPETASIGAANPVVLGGTAIALSNPFALAAPAGGPGAGGGLGLDATLDGWWGVGDLDAKVGVSFGDQSTGGIISFGPAGSAQRGLGLLATSSTGSTAVGLKLVNATTQVLDRIQLGFTGALWRQAPNAKSVAVTYSVQSDSGAGFPTTNGLSISSLDLRFTPGPTGSAPVAVDGTLPENRVSRAVDGLAIDGWVPGSALWLVWRMPDAAAQGQGVALDDLTFSASSSAPPELSVRRTATGIEVTWPALPSGFVLQTTARLDAAGNWSPAPSTVETLPTGFRSVVPIGDTATFLRLSR